MFSVVIPLYNKEKQIAETLKSVLQQTYTNFEIVIVNDGSKDKSAQVVKSFDDNRIRLIDQENGGVSAARNRGIREAKYEWIAFLDADDLWRTDKLEKVAGIIKEFQEVSWLISGYQSIKGPKKYNYIYNYSGFFSDGLDDLNKGLSIQTSTVVVRRKYFLEDDKLFFKLGLNHSEDREVWYKLLFRYPNPYYIQEALSKYIIDIKGNSLNTSNLENFSFLDLKDRIREDYYLLDKERVTKIENFLNTFNRKALWNKWINKGQIIRYEKYLSNKDVKIMKMCSIMPKILRKIVFKVSFKKTCKE